MKFHILKCSKNNVGKRLCCITEWGSKTDLQLDTPLCMIYTRAGHIPHLTGDALDVTCLIRDSSVWHMSLPTSAWSSFQIDTDTFELLQRQLQVDCFQAFCDADTPPDASATRCRKAVDRTISFASTSLEIGNKLSADVFASIVGGREKFELRRCCRQLAKLPFQGYMFEGFHGYGQLTDFKVSSVANLLQHCLDTLPKELPRFFPGALDPTQVLELVDLGCDLFDSSYAYLLTKKGQALVLDESFPAEPKFHLIDDFDVLCADCTCYTCSGSKYTKAYLNHLMVTHELLGPVLLQMRHGIYPDQPQNTADDDKFIEFYREFLDETKAAHISYSRAWYEKLFKVLILGYAAIFSRIGHKIKTGFVDGLKRLRIK
ncbi:unnamed protein product [Soboliphyme baturini]|uniref:TGT domain-containing protein n=1 Tax=Soboliphyme baturini TaxID=241478 RepID=A0A183IEW6_9BILA|nr:unnamed protein product [Soboliphyme baturini]